MHLLIHIFNFINRISHAKDPESFDWLRVYKAVTLPINLFGRYQRKKDKQWLI